MSIEALSLIGVIIALALFMFLVFKGVHMFVTVMFCGALVAVFSGMPIYETLTDTFLGGFAGYVGSMMPTFVMGAIFGKIIGMTGAAESIARKMVSFVGLKYVDILLTLVTSILVAGGVNAFVVVFAVFPLCLVMFKEADYPRRFIPGLIYTGMVVGGAFPGSPSPDMLMCVNSLGVTLTAGFVVGWVVNIFYWIFGPFCVHYVVMKAKKNGEHFVAKPQDVISDDWNPETAANPWLALLCMGIVLFLCNFKMNGQTVFAAPAALFLGSVATLLIMFKWVDWKQVLPSTVEGFTGGMAIVTTVATVTGFGTIVKAAPCFSTISNALLNAGNVLIGAAIGTGALAAIAASATGGLGILLSFMSQFWLTQTQVSVEAIARTIKTACGTFDSLPHNGVVNSVMGGVCGETHKTAYGLFIWTSIIMPLIGTLICIVLFLAFPALQTM